MRVVSHVAKLAADLEWSEDDLGRALGIDPRSAQKLITDTKWELRRETLHKLLLLGFHHGFERGVFEVRHHELWDTFKAAEATIYRADLTWDSRVETSIREFLAHLECASTIASAAQTQEEICETMRTRNCIFVGSPKANSATEVALTLLDGAQPFDPGQANRERVTVTLIGRSERHRDGQSAVLSPGSSCAILLRVPARRTPIRVKVDWLLDEDFKGPGRTGQDAAAVVVCRKPLNAEAQVTTIVICGYSGLATHQAADDLMHGEPPITLEQLDRGGTPIPLVYTFQYKKRAFRGGRSLDALKSVVPKSGQWMPPW
jgi:hypothetical protein